MYIITNVLVHHDVSYFDINAAGPTLVEHLDLVPKGQLTKKEKQIRNIEYGKLIKKLGINQLIPNILFSYTKLLCFDVNGVLYTQDSVVCNKLESVLVDRSIFTFKRVWTASTLIIDKNRKSYIAQTDNGIIIKGNEMPVKLVEKFFQLISNDSNWLRSFKFLFPKFDIEYFVTNKDRIFLYDRILEDINDTKLLKSFKNKINLNYYWSKFLPYFQSVFLYY